MDYLNHGKFSANAQNMDIAPTLLDYMNIEIPDWMKGNSLIDENYEAGPIISLSVVNKLKGDSIDYQAIEPPFYQFGWIQTIICDDFYRINLSDYSWAKSKIEREGDVCINPYLNDLDVIALMIDHLDTYGFDTTVLRKRIFENNN